MHKVLDLFSGIGGFSLGLERTGGFTTSAFCEICPKARKVLRKHWADVPIYDDIKTLTAEKLRNDGIEIDCITGGFPCQDISCAGKGEGIIGKRSSLWSEMFRLIGDVRPKWVIAENVSAIRSKGLTLVLQDISSLGYDAEWHCIPASAVGAPHKRDRIWIIAYTASSSERAAQGQHCGQGFIGRKNEDFIERYKVGGNITNSGILSGIKIRQHEYWAVESDILRVAHGVPHRVDRLKQLGNSLVPQIPELIGNAILESENI